MNGIGSECVALCWQFTGNTHLLVSDKSITNRRGDANEQWQTEVFARAGFSHARSA